MAIQQSLWHVNDVVAYDLMRELSASVQARLLNRVRTGDSAAQSELLELRAATLHVDGYDRSAIDAFTQQLHDRDAQLTQADPGAG